MNANELADALKAMESGWFDDLTLKQAATMLRQQQAEIERLTKENRDLGYYIDGWHKWKLQLQEFIK
jgi:hypothetical protein